LGSTPTDERPGFRKKEVAPRRLQTS
jgi:hypothetical protein